MAVVLSNQAASVGGGRSFRLVMDQKRKTPPTGGRKKLQVFGDMFPFSNNWGFGGYLVFWTQSQQALEVFSLFSSFWWSKKKSKV